MTSTVTTTIWMNEENVHKFINLYGEGNGKFSLSLVISEPKEWTNEMFSGDCPDRLENTCMRAKWRTENWGTVTEAMGIEDDGLDLREILSGQASFQTSDTPPVKVLEKMAADGLKFETDFIRESWESGSCKVRNGKFQYAFDSDK